MVQNVIRDQKQSSSLRTTDQQRVDVDVGWCGHIFHQGVALAPQIKFPNFKIAWSQALLAVWRQWSKPWTRTARAFLSSNCVFFACKQCVWHDCYFIHVDARFLQHVRWWGKVDLHWSHDVCIYFIWFYNVWYRFSSNLLQDDNLIRDLIPIN